MAAVHELPNVITDVNFSALAIAAVTLAVGVLWPGRLRKFLPPILAALIAGTMLAVLWLGNAPVIGNVPTDLPDVRVPEISIDIEVTQLDVKIYRRADLPSYGIAPNCVSPKTYWCAPCSRR